MTKKKVMGRDNWRIYKVTVYESVLFFLVMHKQNYYYYYYYFTFGYQLIDFVV